MDNDDATHSTLMNGHEWILRDGDVPVETCQAGGVLSSYIRVAHPKLPVVSLSRNEEPGFEGGG